MSAINQLQSERNQLFRDFYHNVLPKRMPISITIPHQVIAEYDQLDPFEFQYDYSKLAESADKICSLFPTDACPVPGIAPIATRVPAFYQFLDSRSFLLSSSGQVQHPEITGMLAEEYDALIEDPYACLLERVIPRLYPALALDQPVSRTLATETANIYRNDQAAVMGKIVQQLVEKYGYYQGPPPGSGGFSAAPYDFLSDLLRGFTNISIDIRRDRQKIAAACEALLPLLYKFGLPDNPHPEGTVHTPLHMPTYMRAKDVEEIWFPTYKKLLEQYSAKGIRVKAFCEDNWMRYLDLLQDLPGGHLLMFEYGDPKTIKEKLGNKFIISGLYPLELISKGTKQQCIDKAKELLDIMLPGGGYLFSFDKVPMTASDINLENLKALVEFLRDYAVYPDHGTMYGTPVNTEGFKVDESVTGFKSKYAFEWDSFKQNYPLVPESARGSLEKAFVKTFRENLSLLF